LGYALEWSEREQLIIDRACAAANRGEQLERIYDEHLVAGDEPGVLVKLSAEIRACERQVVDLTGKVSLGLTPPKSERHERAVQARWDRRDAVGATAATVSTKRKCAVSGSRASGLLIGSPPSCVSSPAKGEKGEAARAAHKIG
jgi:hypothetical protein